jgi:hypothetical protein
MRRAALICALAALPAAVGALRAPHSALTKAARSLDRAATLRGLAAAGLSAALGFVATPSSARAAVVLPDFVKNQMGANAERPFDVGGGGRRTGRSGYLVRAQQQARATRQEASRLGDDPSRLARRPAVAFPCACVAAEPVPFQAVGPDVHLVVRRPV